jgi:predicted nucleic-acid-binding protein
VKTFLDTNLVVRYLTGAPADHYRRAQALIDGETALLLTDVVIMEAAYTLRTHYGVGREQVVDVLVELLRRENILVHNLDRDVVIEALLLCRPSGRINFGDAMIWANLRCAQPARLYSFDERFPAGSIELHRP